MNSQPKISIVTVTYNAEEHLEKTIQSIINQTYSNIEYLIIDGASKDRTLEIAERYREHISFLLSEKDKSLYDGMNKGLKHATGDYIMFMNAGDCIAQQDSLEKMLEGSNNADFIYGLAEYVNEQNERRPWHKKTPPAEQLTVKSFINGMVICHQCMLVKKSIAPEFNLGPWQVSNDLEWTIRVMKRVKTKHFYNKVFCSFLEGGYSAKQRNQSVRERFNICVKHFGLIPTILQQFKIAFKILKRGKI